MESTFPTVSLLGRLSLLLLLLLLLLATTQQRQLPWGGGTTTATTSAATAFAFSPTITSTAAAARGIFRGGASNSSRMGRIGIPPRAPPATAAAGAKYYASDAGLVALRASSVSADGPSSSSPSSPRLILNSLVAAVGDKVEAAASKLRAANENTKWRVAAYTCLASVLVFRRSIDVWLARLWNHLMTSRTSFAARLFRCDSFEWCLAVTAFVVYIHGFYLADRIVDKASAHGRVHPWRKYRLQDRYEADKKRRYLLSATMPMTTAPTKTKDGAEVSSNAVNGEEAVERNMNFATKQSEWNWQGWVFELWVYVLPLLTWDIVSPRRHRRLAPFVNRPPTTVQMLGGIASALLLYDALFFCGHYLMHKVPFLYRTVHAKHHKVQEVRAGEIVRLSAAEEVLEVGFSIVALNLLSVHPLARPIYNCIITFLLTELHCGFDFPWSPQNILGPISTGSRRHHYHHRHGKYAVIAVLKLSRAISCCCETCANLTPRNPFHPSPLPRIRH